MLGSLAKYEGRKQLTWCKEIDEGRPSDTAYFRFSVSSRSCQSQSNATDQASIKGKQLPKQHSASFDLFWNHLAHIAAIPIYEMNQLGKQGTVSIT